MKAILTALAGAALLTACLSAQQEITVRIREGMPLIPVAIPEFTASGSESAAAIAAEMYDTLSNDLAFSRVFRLIPREHHQYISRFNPAAINFKDWASIQANILLCGQLEATGDDRLVLSIKAYEVGGEKFIFGRNFGGRREFARLIAHRVADEMMKHFGEKPLFTSKIVYIHEQGDEREVYIMDWDGSRPTRITYNSAIDMLPSWSRGNEKILYTSYRRLAPDLYMFDLFSGKTELVSSGGINYSADWSPVEDKIVYTSSKGGNADIYLRDMRSGQERRLTFNPAIDTSPCWSPNGKEVAFVSSRSGSPQIYIMDAEGANVRRITTEGSYHDSPAWSPDGSRLAFVSRIDDRFDIYLYTLKTNEFGKLTENSGRNENPTWSPDGRHLAFSSTRNGRAQIYLVDYDGSNVRQLTSEGANKMPKWQKAGAATD